MDALSLLASDVAFQVSNFMTLGGDVLWLIAAVIFVMWALVIERAVYFYVRYPRQAKRVQALWDARGEHYSWQSHQIRNALVAGMRGQVRIYISTVKTLVAICPLLGLLGTVTGMIAVFDVMANAGMGNPRLMADGVAKATVPTMAGMVGALSGVFAIYWLDWQAKRKVSLIADRLVTEHEHD